MKLIALVSVSDVLQVSIRHLRPIEISSVHGRLEHLWLLLLEHGIHVLLWLHLRADVLVDPGVGRVRRVYQRGVQ